MAILELLAPLAFLAFLALLALLAFFNSATHPHLALYFPPLTTCRGRKGAKGAKGATGGKRCRGLLAFACGSGEMLDEWS